MGLSSTFTAVSVLLAFSSVVDAQKCNADNVVRALRRGGNPATNLCDSLILYSVPTVTVVPPPGVTSPPAVVTTTSTITRTVYPEGLTLESLSFPPYISSYPASRISSGCSCLLGPHPTTTLTSSGPTITQTIITTKTSTLSGPCATLGVFAPERFVPEPDETVIERAVPLSNAYACCKSCRSYRPGFCLAYFNIPGDSCSLLTVDKKPENPPSCPNVDESATFFVFVNRYPNRTGGRGVCGVNFFLLP